MNPHSVLGVAADATPEQIKKAYRKLAMKHHPDRNGGSDEAEKKFQEIQNAYDMLRSDKPKQQSEGPRQHHGADPHMQMHEIFEHFFRQQQMGNPTLQAHCAITLEQAYQGCTVSFNVNGKSVAVNIPAGIGHGQMLRVPGGAGQPNPDYPAGDLHVAVMMQPHEKFQRNGMTLISRQNIDLLDLITGCEMEVETLMNGKKKVTVPANTTPDSCIVVDGEGMPVPNSSDKGDLMVHFNVVYPTFTEDQLTTLRAMKKA